MAYRAASNRSTAGRARIARPGVRFSKGSRRQVTTQERRQNKSSMAQRAFEAEMRGLEAKLKLNSRLAYCGHVLRILIAARLSHTMRGIFPRPAHQPAKTPSSMRSTRAASRSLNSSSRRTDRSLNPAPGWVSRILVRTVLAQGNGGAKRDAWKGPSPRICSLILVKAHVDSRAESHDLGVVLHNRRGILCNGSSRGWMTTHDETR